MKIFPNPATLAQIITVLLDEEIHGNVSIGIYSVEGMCVYRETFYKASRQYNHALPLGDLARGVYEVRLTNEAKVGIQKLIIE